MASIADVPRSELWSPGYTLRELAIRYDAKLIETWDHTSCIRSSVYALACLVAGALSKSKPKPKPPMAFHPYRKRQTYGVRIGKENFEDLKLLGNAMAGS